MALPGCDLSAMDAIWSPGPAIVVLGHLISGNAEIREEWFSLRLKLYVIFGLIPVVGSGDKI